MTKSVQGVLGRVVLALVVLAGAAACGSPDGEEGSTTATTAGVGDVRVVQDELDPATGAALDAAVRRGHAEISAPGAVVAVRGPAGTWIAAIGATEWDGTTPMTADVHQRVGSITKTFTSTLLLQLAAEGRLSLDDPIGTYVPGLSNPQATLGQLSAMRSGIPSYTLTDTFASALFAEPDRSWTPQELVGLVDGSAPLFEPGAAFDYSNTNIVLLGMVIEQVTGRPVHEVIQERIAGPLGLERTALPTDAALPDPHARGYTLQGQDGRVPADATDWNPSWAWTAGGMISTVDDLLVYGRELVAGDRLLGAAAQAERLGSFQPMVAGEPARAYGYGLSRSNGWTGHTGELPGFNSFMYHHLESGYTVVVLVDSDIASGACPAGTPSVPDGRTTGPCLDPAVHVADLVTAALGYPGNPADVGAAPIAAPATTSSPR